LSFLAVERRFEPFAGRWALPGGFVEVGEDLAVAAARELAEETGLRGLSLEQLGAWGAPDRDPRGHTVTVVYLGVAPADAAAAAGDDAAAVRWHPVLDPPALAFDHGEMLRVALQRVRTKLEYTTIGFQLLPGTFTLGELQQTYEIVLDRELDKRNFRRRLKLLGLVQATGEKRAEGVGRPAELYRFSGVDFTNLREKGFYLPF